MGFKAFCGSKKLATGKENEKRCNKDQMLKYWLIKFADSDRYINYHIKQHSTINIGKVL